jgi:hypothetical protein
VKRRARRGQRVDQGPENRATHHERRRVKRVRVSDQTLGRSPTHYSIVARYSLATDPYVKSAECGIVLRKAFMTGVAQ